MSKNGGAITLALAVFRLGAAGAAAGLAAYTAVREKNRDDMIAEWTVAGVLVSRPVSGSISSPTHAFAIADLLCRPLRSLHLPAFNASVLRLHSHDKTSQHRAPFRRFRSLFRPRHVSALDSYDQDER